MHTNLDPLPYPIVSAVSLLRFSGAGVQDSRGEMQDARLALDAFLRCSWCVYSVAAGAPSAASLLHTHPHTLRD